jgi:hypothetical protein
MKFGAIDKTDFLIPPVMLFYFYPVFAHAFGWPSVAKAPLLDSLAMAWAGVAICTAGLLLLLWRLMSFKQRLRVGIDSGKAKAAPGCGIAVYAIRPQRGFVGFRLGDKYLASLSA